MIQKRFTVLAIVLLIVAAPAFAAAQPQEMQASGALTASGNTAAFKLSTATNVVVSVNVTAISGTSPFLDLWVQGSSDGGATWYDYPATETLVSANAASAGVIASVSRDIVNNITTGATGQYIGLYKGIATNSIRLRWIVSGTTPSFTLSAWFVAK
jgi:hypothetical protein